MSSPAAPARLGRYELLARIATGGMGEIFLARLEGAAGFEKLFVVKRILPHLADDVRFRGMLIAEARIASKMAHANICQVYELGETDGQLYIVMEYLEGVALLTLLRKASKEYGSLALGLIGGIVQQTTDALHYAHELRDRGGESFGIVHRDVTPGNVFLTEGGMAKVLDFGIAKVKDASANTQTGTVKGKYAYMAPEQLRGTSVDRRVDVFALGVVLYEMLALRRLFQRKTDYLTFRAVMEQPIPDVRKYRPDVPEQLADVLARALDRDPDGRYATARLFGGAVVDAIGTRAWSQSDIGDYVRTHFSDELSKRREQTAHAIQRSAGAFELTVASAEAATQVSDDDDDGFPSVESVGEAAPLERRARVPDFAGQTPPPFAIDTHSGENLKSLRHAEPAPPPPQMVVVAKRGLFWPIFAIAMVAIAGAALFLVWRQMSRQPPQEIIITQTAYDAEPEASPLPVSGAAPAEPPRPPPPKPRPPRPTDPYTAAITAHKPMINKCALEHGLSGTAKVVLIVATSGRTKEITFEPAALNGSPVGACIRHALSEASFPPARDEKRVVVPVSVKSG